MISKLIVAFYSSLKGKNTTSIVTHVTWNGSIVVCVSLAYMFALENSKQVSKSLRYTMKRSGPKDDS